MLESIGRLLIGGVGFYAEELHKEVIHEVLVVEQGFVVGYGGLREGAGDYEIGLGAEEGQRGL